ncbi:MAG: NifB/NifX family molybdenum-iron cluster-binding protein [Candidatus Heimdallarchaeaceae archaeon]|jgi:predicted Fe-Mo cluster-binding NifX family protein
MKIAIPVMERSEKPLISERFGRSLFFAIFDSETNQIGLLDNPATEARGGAGVLASEFLVSKGVESVIAIEVGPKAERVLRSSNISIFQGDKVSIEELIEKWKKNVLKNMK